MYLAVTSLDSGPFLPDDAEKVAGWWHKTGITYSPRIESLKTLPPHELYDEWYIFRAPRELGEIDREDVFNAPISPGHVEVFVNFYGFALDAPEVQELVSLFWRQMERIQPESYLAQSDYGFMTFVTRDPKLFARVAHQLQTSR
jgi:hypothetical protein